MTHDMTSLLAFAECHAYFKGGTVLLELNVVKFCCLVSLRKMATKQGRSVGKRKTAEEKADEERRYALALAITTDEEFEPFFVDPNQAIRNTAAMNPDASVEVLERFSTDRFWSVRMAVVDHPKTSRETLLGLLEGDPRRRGVVHYAARSRLESEGVRFDVEGMPELN